MTWTVIIAKATQKQLARFPAKDQDKIAATIRTMAENPFSGDSPQHVEQLAPALM